MSKIHVSISGVGAQNFPPISMLRAFERAASRLSFKQAARDLSLTPSAISHQIRGLEHHFGVRLFVRSGRSVRLTQEGQQYLHSVRSALVALEEGSRTLFSDSIGKRELRISALPFFVSMVMLPNLDIFTRKFPGVTLRIEATPTYADFETSGVDVAVRMGHERSAGLHFDRLMEVYALPVCSPTLISGGPELKTPADLAHCTLLKNSLQPNTWQSWLDDAGLPDLSPAGELWFDNVSLTLEAAEHGLGVALAMDPLIQRYKGFGASLVAPLPLSTKTKRTYYAVCRPEQKDDRVVTGFRRWLLQAARGSVLSIG